MFLGLKAIGKPTFFACDFPSIFDKMNRFVRLFLYSMAVFSLAGCASFKQKKWLEAHHSQLEQAAANRQSAEEKMEILLTNYVDLMNEGLCFVNPVKGAKFIGKYERQNRAAIDKIVAESIKSMSELTDLQKITLGARLLTKPWFRDFVELAPKFKRKYEQYKFVAEMTGKVAGGFGKVGSKLF